jgi:hypothetical protein
MISDLRRAMALNTNPGSATVSAIVRRYVWVVSACGKNHGPNRRLLDQLLSKLFKINILFRPFRYATR